MADQLLASLRAMWERCIKEKSRGLVVVQGGLDQAESAAGNLLLKLLEHDPQQACYTENSDSTLLVYWVANDLPSVIPHRNHRYVLQHVHQKQAVRLLGSDTSCVVVNGFDSFNLNMLGQVVNTLSGGGLLFLILPAEEDCAAALDYSTKTVRNAASISRFYRLLAEFQQSTPEFRDFSLSVMADGAIARFEQETSSFKRENRHSPSAGYTCEPKTVSLSTFVPTEDQKSVVSALLTELNKTQASCFLIADRGRGKSTALGLLAAELAASGMRMLVTSSHQRHASRMLSVARQRGVDESALRFLPVDVLAESLIEFDANSILFIDEAAALSASLLQRLVERFQRIVFSTTAEGYEGSASGFYSRFKHSLVENKKNVRELHLRDPLRWSIRCNLERLFAQLLGSDFTHRLYSSSDISSDTQAAIVIRKLTAADFQRSESLLQQVFSLLRNAHYQTQPSDLQLLLEGCYHLWASLVGEQVVSVLLVFDEGGFSDDKDSLLQGIVTGTRRPAGSLVAQKLANETGDEAWCRFRSMRVVRIATLQAFRRKGYAAQLLESLVHYAKEKQVDFLSSSFGINPALTSFWWQSGFTPVFLGARLDKASGANNLLVVRPLRDEVSRKAALWQKHWAGDLALVAHRFMPAIERVSTEELVREAASGLEFEVAQDTFDNERLLRFVRGEIALASVFAVLVRFDQRINKKTNVSLSLKAFVKHAPDWNRINEELQTDGKKQALSQLKDSIQHHLADANL